MNAFMNCQDQHLNFAFCIRTLTLDVIHAQESITVRGPKQWEIRLKKQYLLTPKAIHVQILD